MQQHTNHLGKKNVMVKILIVNKFLPLLRENSICCISTKFCFLFAFCKNSESLAYAVPRIPQPASTSTLVIQPPSERGYIHRRGDEKQQHIKSRRVGVLRVEKRQYIFPLAQKKTCLVAGLHSSPLRLLSVEKSLSYFSPYDCSPSVQNGLSLDSILDSQVLNPNIFKLFFIHFQHSVISIVTGNTSTWYDVIYNYLQE